MESNIQIIKGNIFDSKCQTIVNTINCVGVMGKGLALEFKKRYPDMFLRYREYCSLNLMCIGKLWLYKSNDYWILNFPTKMTWKLPSRYEYIELGLQKFVDTYKERGITSIAFPMLGCSNGKLDEDKVLHIMYNYLSKCDIPIEIYRHKK
jgi:O-acetyl-ADP-ribose deacetylase (regulator of RNase III)